MVAVIGGGGGCCHAERGQQIALYGGIDQELLLTLGAEELALEPVELPLQRFELRTQQRVLLLQLSDADRRGHDVFISFLTACILPDRNALCSLFYSV